MGSTLTRSTLTGSTLTGSTSTGSTLMGSNSTAYFNSLCKCLRVKNSDGSKVTAADMDKNMVLSNK